MSAYKVFQAAAVDFHLEPGRYEDMAFTKLTARFSLVMDCDWVAKLQDGLNFSVSNDEMDVEAMRSKLCDFYSNGRAEQASLVNEQWRTLINDILVATAWQGVNSGAGATRTVLQAKVDADLAYRADITVDGNGFANVSSSSALAIDGSRKCCGIAAKASQDQYDHEAIGQLVNNTNMREVLLKMRNHGCFVKDSDSTDDFEVNPTVAEDTSGADSTTDTKRLLENGDELIFPVNLKSIVGHTATSGDENMNDGKAFELNIVFKQNVDTDDVAGHSNLAATTLSDSA